MCKDREPDKKNSGSESLEQQQGGEEERVKPGTPIIPASSSFFPYPFANLKFGPGSKEEK